MNQEVELQHCIEHGGRTCCNNQDVMPIRQKMGLARHGNSPRITNNCFTMTSKVLCSKCDADIGTGLNSDGIFCLRTCEQWYNTCRDDFIDPYIDPSDQVPFCKEDSMICSKISDIADSPSEFCKYMGYKVLSPTDQDLDVNKNKLCFNGYSRQI